VKRWRVTFKAKDGSVQRVSLLAKNAEEAQKEAERSQFRRESRFPLTFARLSEAASTGEPGMLAIDPRFAGAALTEAWVEAETERRKRDQARYEGAGLKVVSVEEVK
jgi:hypothetical protein